MRIQKIQGASEGYFLTIGDTMFAIGLCYNTQVLSNELYSKFSHEQMVAYHTVTADIRNNSRHSSPQPTGEISLAFAPFAYKQPNKPWVLSKNPNSDQMIGRVLSNTNYDKRDRLSYEEFLEQLIPVYAEACHKEAELAFELFTPPNSKDYDDTNN